MALTGTADADGTPVTPVITLTLAQAEEIALENEPRLGAARLLALAQQQTIAEARSAYFPQVAGNLTGTLGDYDTAVAAGALTTSSLSTRFASGLALHQLITDFGRTSAVVRSAQLDAKSRTEDAWQVRAEVLLAVRQAYYQVLGAQAVLRAAKASLDTRRLMLKRVQALARSSLRSTLDVSFAEVLVSQAELALYRTQDIVQESHAEFGAALGYDQERVFILSDPPGPGRFESEAELLVKIAMKCRPDLQAAKLHRDAAYQFAKAEGRLYNPTVDLMAAGGEIPYHDATLHHDYGAAGVNINIPVFNGGLFAARYREAKFKAQAADKQVDRLAVSIAREVRIAWAVANDAFRQLAQTRILLAQTNEALRLARTRYDNGLGSIVELSQAQLNQTAAEVDVAGAQYTYLGARAALDYATGQILGNNDGNQP